MAVAVAFHATGVLVVVLAIVAMVMLHELGHFATAKLSGMKVTEYFFGFGPRLWAVVRGETTYGVKALPAGGYVKIVGMTMLEDVAGGGRAPQLSPGDLSRAGCWSRAPARSCTSSSPLRSLWSVFTFLGTAVPSAPHRVEPVQVDNRPGPATVAGVKPGDVFVSINGRPTPTFDSLTAVIATSAGKPLHVVVRRGGRLVASSSRRRRRPTRRARRASSPRHTKGEIGVELLVTKQVSYGPFDVECRKRRVSSARS